MTGNIAYITIENGLISAIPLTTDTYKNAISGTNNDPGEAPRAGPVYGDRKMMDEFECDFEGTFRGDLARKFWAECERLKRTPAGLAADILIAVIEGGSVEILLERWDDDDAERTGGGDIQMIGDQPIRER